MLAYKYYVFPFYYIYRLIQQMIPLDTPPQLPPNTPPPPSPVASVDASWIHHQIQTPKHLLECPVCFQYIFQPVECEQCQRIFCKQDYCRTKQSNDSCPLCKASPWVIKEKIHISYKILRQLAKFDCKLCTHGSALNETELRNHLKSKHNKEVKQYRRPLYKYTVIESDGNRSPLSKYQNIQINYKQKGDKKQIKIMHDKLNSLKINLTSMKYTCKDMNGYLINGKLQKEQAKKDDQINENTQYIVWTFKNDGDHHQFFSDDHQEQLEKAYRQFKTHQYKFQTHLDLAASEIRYRIDFVKMNQFNTQTQFQRSIERETIRLNSK